MKVFSTFIKNRYIIEKFYFDYKRLFIRCLTGLSDQWKGAACASCLYEGVPYMIITPSSLKKNYNSVGSVGKSEKSPENSL
jgi:hypothetical protein